MTRENPNLTWISTRKLEPGFEMYRHIISSIRIRTFVFVFCHQMTQIRGHVTRRKVNESDAASSSFDFDRSRHVSQRHHARRFDAGRDDDDRPSSVSALAGSDVIGLAVDFEDEISGVEVRNVVFRGRRVCCRRSVESCRPGHQGLGGDRRVHRWSPSGCRFSLWVDPPDERKQSYYFRNFFNRECLR